MKYIKFADHNDDTDITIINNKKEGYQRIGFKNRLVVLAPGASATLKDGELHLSIKLKS